MHPTVREYRIPLTVTGIGISIACILAFAPALMAESDAEALTKKNASNLKTLTESLESRTTELQQQMQAQISEQASTIDRLQNQVSILNKATGRTHLRQTTLIKPAVEISSEFSTLKTNTDTRLINLEKATKQMHLRQRNLTAKVDRENKPQAPNSSTSLRLLNLEKAVKNLHLKSVAYKQSINDTNPSELANRLSLLENSPTSLTPQLTTRIATLEKQAESVAIDQSSRLARLENDILRLSLNRPESNSTSQLSQTTRSSITDIKRRVDIDIRLMRVERQLKRHENRWEDIDGDAREQELVVDQLMEMRSYIDALLSDTYR